MSSKKSFWEAARTCSKEKAIQTDWENPTECGSSQMSLPPSLDSKTWDQCGEWSESGGRLLPTGNVTITYWDQLRRTHCASGNTHRCTETLPLRQWWARIFKLICRARESAHADTFTYELGCRGPGCDSGWQVMPLPSGHCGGRGHNVTEMPFIHCHSPMTQPWLLSVPFHTRSATLEPRRNWPCARVTQPGAFTLCPLCRMLRYQSAFNLYIRPEYSYRWLQ